MTIQSHILTPRSPTRSSSSGATNHFSATITSTKECILLDLPTAAAVCDQNPCKPQCDDQADIQVCYFHEGGANVLFRLKAATGDDDKDNGSRKGNEYLKIPSGQHFNELQRTSLHIDEHLLRLRKQTKTLTNSQKAGCENVEGEISYIGSFIAREIPVQDDLLLPTIIHCTPRFMRRCNDVLKDRERHSMRDLRRHNRYLETTLSLTSPKTTGTLLQYLRSSPALGQFLFEFKPKWLLQSPSAPVDANQCRTCALSASKSIKDSERYCPLALMSPDRAIVEAQVQKMFDTQWTKILANDCTSRFTDIQRKIIIAAIVNYLSRKGGLLQQLARAQARLDPFGILHLMKEILRNKDDDDDDDDDKTSSSAGQVDPKIDKIERALQKDSLRLCQLAEAMTFRDCSMYIMVNINPEDASDATTYAKLGDLDEKLPIRSNFVKWLKAEQWLVFNGNYNKDATTVNSLETHKCVLYHS